MKVLDVSSISVKYGDIQALWDISFSVKKGQLVALIGANGAGKTTTLKAICGLVGLEEGKIEYCGTVTSGWPVHRVVDLGITLVPEGRQLFPKALVLGGKLPEREAKLVGLPDEWERGVLRRYSFCIIRGILQLTYAITISKLIQGKLVVDLRAAVYDKLQRLSFRFYDSNQTASLINRVTGDVHGVSNFINGIKRMPVRFTPERTHHAAHA